MRVSVFTDDELNGILDAWRYNNMFDWENYLNLMIGNREYARCSISPIDGDEVKDYGYLTKEDCRKLMYNNVYHRRCGAVKKKLCNEGINVKDVENSNILGLDAYKVKCEGIVSSYKIADALDIPKEWVDVVDSKENIFVINQKEFNERYCNSDGEIDFPVHFDELNSSYKRKSCIEKLMDVELINESTDNDLFMFKVRNEPYRFNRYKLAEKLDIESSRISCYDNNGVWIYIIKLEKE